MALAFTIYNQTATPSFSSSLLDLVVSQTILFALPDYPATRIQSSQQSFWIVLFAFVLKQLERTNKMHALRALLAAVLAVSISVTNAGR